MDSIDETIASLGSTKLSKNDIKRVIDVIAKGIEEIHKTATNTPIDYQSICSGPTYYDVYIEIIINEAEALKKLVEILRTIDL